MASPTLKSFRLQNFKAVQDSGTVKFTPLTVLIGNNGSGKSSLVEGLETYQSIVVDGLDKAMREWLGFEYVWNQAAPHKPKSPKGFRPRHSNPMRFTLRGAVFSAMMEVNLESNGGPLYIEREEFTTTIGRFFRDCVGKVVKEPPSEIPIRIFPDGESVLNLFTDLRTRWIPSWQFVSFIPQNMGAPAPQKRTGGPVRLHKDGSNIAEYLMSIRKLDQGAFDGILETLAAILPYAKDLQPTLTSEIERAVYLQMTEGTYKVPGWLLSTGTLRLVCLLALFRHPTPPPLIVIEEIENGLDPRTIHLIVDEIRALVESGKSQVIATTHSPYLLDLLHLSQIVLVERIDGEPTFRRPADDESLREWSKKYGPGKLYTMDLLHRKGER